MSRRIGAIALISTIALLLGGCAAHVGKRCPTCAVVDARSRQLPALKPGTERLFVLVPGLLGYGWEWDAPVARLRATPGVDFVVFWWEPWGSVDRAARELDGLLTRALAEAPPSVREIVVVAHSAGGLIAAHAVGRLPPPARKVTLVTIGAPFAGMHICPWSEVDIIHAPLMLGVAAVYHKYPQPPPGVDVIEYITKYPADPVMHPHWGTTPSQADVGPAGARRIEVDPKLDHNDVVERVMNDLLTGK